MAGELLTGSAQIEWSGLLLGDGTDLFVSGLDGWHDLPPLDSGNVGRSQAHGSWAGRMLAQERIVTVDFDVRPEVQATEALLSALRAATVPSVDGTESALVVRDYGTALLAFGQVARRKVPMGLGFQRRLTGCAIQWVCSDPRRYSIDEETATISGPTSGSGGLVYPLVFPLDYGTPGTPGGALVTNSGDVATNPVVTIRGPVTGPLVENQTTGRVLEFDLELEVGDELVVDTYAGTARLVGLSRISTLTPSSAPLQSWTLPPGESSLVFRGGTFPAAGASCSLAWRSAWW